MREELLAFAEKIAAPIVLTLPGKGAIPDEHPYCLWRTWINRDKASV